MLFPRRTSKVKVCWEPQVLDWALMSNISALSSKQIEYREIAAYTPLTYMDLVTYAWGERESNGVSIVVSIGVYGVCACPGEWGWGLRMLIPSHHRNRQPLFMCGPWLP